MYSKNIGLMKLCVRIA